MLGDFDYVSTHSRLKAAGRRAGGSKRGDTVSTHSRLKAAGVLHFLKKMILEGFNTQPPEGGWGGVSGSIQGTPPFQHTAA